MSLSTLDTKTLDICSFLPKQESHPPVMPHVGAKLMIELPLLPAPLSPIEHQAQYPRVTVGEDQGPARRLDKTGGISLYQLHYDSHQGLPILLEHQVRVEVCPEDTGRRDSLHVAGGCQQPGPLAQLVLLQVGLDRNLNILSKRVSVRIFRLQRAELDQKGDGVEDLGSF